MRRGRLKEAGLKEVLNRIVRKVRNSELAKQLSQRVTKYWKTEDKNADLTNQETAQLYRDVNLDDVIPLSKKRKLDIDWTGHAKYRSELRDVDPEKVKEGIRDKMRTKLQKQKMDRKTDRLKLPGVGTAVVNYDLTRKPSEVDIVTVWASELTRTASMLAGRDRENAHALLRLAKQLLAGRMEPPPKMVKKIGDWVWDVAQLQSEMETLKFRLSDEKQAEYEKDKKMLKKLKGKKKRGKVHLTEEEEEELKWLTKVIPRRRKMMTESRNKIKSLRKSLKEDYYQDEPWFHVTKKFKLDLSGWKYLPLFRKHSRFPAVKKARQDFATISVMVTEKLPSMDSYGGFWREQDKVIAVKIGGHPRENELRTTVHHECMHMGQSLMTQALGKERTDEGYTFGMPPKGARQPGRKYLEHIPEGQQQEEAPEGVQPSLYYHALVDVEFQTDMHNAFASWDEMIADVEKEIGRHEVWLRQERLPKKLTKANKRRLFEVFVGAARPFTKRDLQRDDQLYWAYTWQDEGPKPSRFFKAWKKGSRDKYKRAVKELVRHAL